MAGGLAGIAPLIGGGIGAIGSIVGGGKQAQAAQTAGADQLRAAQAAIAAEQGQYQQGTSILHPFIGYGQDAIGQIESLIGIGSGTSPANVLTAPLTSIPDSSYTQFSPTVQQLEQTPGYQFQLAVGSDMTKNALTAQGGRAIGGSLATGMEQFGTGLAQSTWVAQLQAYMQQYAQRLAGIQQGQASKAQTYNMLTGPISMGASGATSQLGAAVNVGGQIAQQQNFAGAAGAGAALGVGAAGAGAITGATGNIANSLALYSALQQNQGMYGANPDPGLAYMQNPNLMVNETP